MIVWVYVCAHARVAMGSCENTLRKEEIRKRRGRGRNERGRMRRGKTKRRKN